MVGTGAAVSRGLGGAARRLRRPSVHHRRSGPLAVAARRLRRSGGLVGSELAGGLGAADHAVAGGVGHRAGVRRGAVVQGAQRSGGPGLHGRAVRLQPPLLALAEQRHGRRRGAAVEEGVLADLHHRWAPLGLALQHLAHKVLAALADLHGRGEREAALLDARVRRLDVVGLEGGLAHEQRVQDHAQAPHVHLERVTLAGALQDLGRDVVGRPADRALPLAVKLQLGRKPKVADLDVHLDVHHHVAQLKVAVQHVVLVHVLDRRDGLHHDELRLFLAEARARAGDLHQRLVAALLKHNVHVPLVLEGAEELDDVCVA